MVIGSNTIEMAMTYKLLGVYVSNDLKWNHHVEVIVQKENRRLYSLRVVKQCGAPPASLAKVYTTIVRPVLEYAAPVWQNIPDFLPYKIESIQRSLGIIIILDLALAAPRVLPVGPSARKSLSRISIPSGLYNYIF